MNQIAVLHVRLHFAEFASFLYVNEFSIVTSSGVTLSQFILSANPSNGDAEATGKGKEKVSECKCVREREMMIDKYMCILCVCV